MKKKVINFIVVLTLLANITVYAEMSFTDVNKNDWYYDSVMYASEKGIINGIGNNQFNPQGILTVAEAIKLSASIHANYNNYEDLKPSTASTHWAEPYYDYAVTNGIIKETDFSKADFDNAITRNRMFYIFANTLPDKEYPEINEVQNAPEQPSNEYTRKLFCAGIVIGNEKGFEEDKNITRAETAEIVLRMTAHSKRRLVFGAEETPPVYTPEQTTPVQPQQPVTPQQPTTPVQPGQVQTAKPYKNIPNTNWQSDPTGGVTIQSHSGYINTKYGNHTYGCKSQEEYDKVMSVMDETYNYASQKEANKTYRKGSAYKTYVQGSHLKFYRDEVGMTNDNDIMSIGVTEAFVEAMADYLRDTYAHPNGAGTNTDADNNNVYKYLFGGGYLDCDGKGHLHMLCYDYLGFSTRMIGSYNITHAAAQVYVNGEWVLVDQNSGKLDDVTHSQIKELMSGIKNDAYEDEWANCDKIVATASSNPQKLSDLAIRVSPTHAPNDRSL